MASHKETTLETAGYLFDPGKEHDVFQHAPGFDIKTASQLEHRADMLFGSASYLAPETATDDPALDRPDSIPGASHRDHNVPTDFRAHKAARYDENMAYLLAFGAVLLLVFLA